MNSLKKWLIVLSVMILLIFLLIRSVSMNTEDNESLSKNDKYRVDEASPKREGLSIKNDRTSPRLRDNVESGLTRKEHLLRLNNLWSQFKSGSDGINDFDDREKLARESVKELMFSAEFFELEKFLIEENILTDRQGAGLWWFLNQSLSGEDSAKIIDSYEELLEGQDRLKIDQSRIDSFAFAIGGSLDADAFEAVYKNLKKIDHALAQESLFGNSRRIVSTDPTALVKVTNDVINALNEGIQSPRSGDVLSSLMQHLNNESDVQEVEKALAKLTSEGMEPNLVKARQELIFRWAVLDLESAAEQVIANPGVYPLDLMENIASVGYDVLEKKSGPEEALRWIRSLPEGDCRNLAILGAARSIFEDDPVKASAIANEMNQSDRQIYFQDYPALK